MYKYKHTIFTPVFNSGELLYQVANSVAELEYDKDKFEWLIIDDGSDQSTKDIIKKIIDNNDRLHIKCISKENGGIHTAMNLAVCKAEGEFFTRIDADDMLLKDALLQKDLALDSIDREKLNNFCGVVGLCLNKGDMSVRGDRFPEDIMDTTGLVLHKKYKLVGDRNFCMKTEIMKKYLVPELPNTKWVPEGIIWNRINRVYLTRFVNVAMSICAEPNEKSMSGDLISKNKSSGAYMSRYYGNLYLINECADILNHFEYWVRFLIVYESGIHSRMMSLSNIIRSFDKGRKRITAYVLLPAGLIWTMLISIWKRFE